MTNLDTLISTEQTRMQNASPGAVAREVCRSLDLHSPARDLLEALLADSNKAAFDRSCILREYEEAAPAAHAVSLHESFERINS